MGTERKKIHNNIQSYFCIDCNANNNTEKITLHEKFPITEYFLEQSGPFL